MGSRTADDHSSGTPVAGRLARPTRAAGGNTCGAAKAPPAPIRSCSRWGLPCRPCCQGRGALLPHPFTLARREPPGGLLSVALSLGSPPPGVTRHRVSVEPGLSSPARIGRRRSSDRLAGQDLGPFGRPRKHGLGQAFRISAATVSGRRSMMIATPAMVARPPRTRRSVSGSPSMTTPARTPNTGTRRVQGMVWFTR